MESGVGKEKWSNDYGRKKWGEMQNPDYYHCCFLRSKNINCLFWNFSCCSGRPLMQVSYYTTCYKKNRKRKYTQKAQKSYTLSRNDIHFLFVQLAKYFWIWTIFFISFTSKKDNIYFFFDFSHIFLANKEKLNSWVLEVFLVNLLWESFFIKCFPMYVFFCFCKTVELMKKIFCSSLIWIQHEVSILFFFKLLLWFLGVENTLRFRHRKKQLHPLN